ncbi:MAG TPA: ABC transporter substrate-binding protein [Azonexus sp.]|nr:ABC transporter substrate-binding protein [Azonexus sp.]
MKIKYTVPATLLLAMAGLAQADINIGVSVSATGPAASLGIPEKNTFAILPSTIAGEKVNYIVLDDATDPGQATKNARKLVSEDKVDVLIGSSGVPASAAIAEVANETATPQIALSPFDLPPAKNPWVFRTPQHVSLMAKALVGHMKQSGVKTLGFIGFNDPYGEAWLKEINLAIADAGIKLAVVERYNRTDTSVGGQVLKLVAARPDAVIVVGSGTPAALPHTTLAERGYKGQIYQTHGAVNKEFLKIGGKALEGGILPAGPVVVAAQLPDSHASKKPALEYVKLYEDKYGPGSVSSFGAHAYDAYKLIEKAIPVALKQAKPGTPKFRQALRDALETERDIVGVHGVYNMSANDHFGLDERARVLVRIENGDWKALAGK